MWLVELKSTGLKLPKWTDTLFDWFVLVKDGLVKLSCDETCLEVEFVLDWSNNMSFSSCLSLWENNRCIHMMNKWKKCELANIQKEKN